MSYEAHIIDEVRYSPDTTASRLIFWLETGTVKQKEMDPSLSPAFTRLMWGYRWGAAAPSRSFWKSFLVMMVESEWGLNRRMKERKSRQDSEVLRLLKRGWTWGGRCQRERNNAQERRSAIMGDREIR